MPKTALTVIVLFFICHLWILIGAYFDGLAFYKSWFYPMTLVPIMLFLALGYVVILIITIVSVLRKKTKFLQLILPATLPLLVFAIPQLPIPGFADGLRVAVKDNLEQDRLLEFAELAKLIADIENQELDDVLISGLSWADADSLEKYEKLKAIYPEALSLSQLPPRIEVSSDEVRIFYGGALTKHWGYTIVDNDMCPFERLSATDCQKVYEYVWVYSDIF